MTTIQVGGQNQLATEGQQFMQALLDSGWEQKDVEEVAPAWGVCQADITTWAGMTEDGQIDHAECEVRTAITAAMSAHILEHRAKVSTPAILKATPEQLEEYATWYESELRTKYQQMQEIVETTRGEHHDNPTWLKLFADFHRLAGYAWECKRRMGTM